MFFFISIFCALLLKPSLCCCNWCSPFVAVSDSFFRFYRFILNSKKFYGSYCCRCWRDCEFLWSLLCEKGIFIAFYYHTLCVPKSCSVYVIAFVVCLWNRWLCDFIGVFIVVSNVVSTFRRTYVYILYRKIFERPRIWIDLNGIRLRFWWQTNSYFSIIFHKKLLLLFYAISHVPKQIPKFTFSS